MVVASVLAVAGLMVSPASPAAAQVVDPGNEVLSWGSAALGLGDGTNVDRHTPGGPVRLPDGTTIDKVDSSTTWFHNYALTSSGLVYAWGLNRGELGDGTTTDRPLPVQVEGLPGDSPVVDITAGAGHGLALTADQRLYAWGKNTYGQLGNGTTTNSLTAVQVTAAWPAGTRFKAIDAGSNHNIALTSTGDLYVWGFNGGLALGDGTPATNSLVPKLLTTLPDEATVTGIAAGYDASFAVLSTGQLYAWGSNYSGRLGVGASACDFGSCQVPQEVPLPGGTTVSAVATGYAHTLAVTTTGAVLAWGRNDAGQLGDGTTTDSDTPVEVSLPEGTTVRTVTAGFAHSFAVTTSGAVLAWGENLYGRLGDGSTTSRDTPVPVLMPAGVQVRGIAASRQSSFAVVSTGPALNWGENTNGQLGNNRREDSVVPVEPVLPEGVTVTDIDGGFQHALAATEGGHVYAWGSNGNGQLGDPGYTAGYSDHPIEADIAGVVQVAGGEQHSLALTSDGDVYAWGANGLGQLGLGHTSVPVRAPTPVLQTWPENVRVVAVAAGDHHSLVLLSDGTVFAWGDDSVGELGSGATGGSSPVPAIVLGLEDLTITDIGTGIGHGVALADTGVVYAWGANSLGQLGSGTSGDPQPTAQPVTGLDRVKVTDVAAGFSHSLALAETGQLYAWGLNNHGQLGNSRVDPLGNPTPQRVDLFNFDGAAIVSIAGGGQHSLAVDSTGQPYGWGYNNHGQVGDGSRTDQRIPVPVELAGEHAGAAVSQVAGGQFFSLAR